MKEYRMVLEKLPTKTANAIDEAGQKIITASTGGIINTVSDLLEGLLGCEIREWKNRNLLRGAKKTYDMAQKMHVDLSKANPLPKSEIYQLFENVSKTDDEMTSDLWAGLLANALKADRTKESRIDLITTIQQLTPLDVKVIDLIYYHSNLLWKSIEDQSSSNTLIENKLNQLSIPDDIRNSIENLYRIGLIELSLELQPPKYNKGEIEYNKGEIEYYTRYTPNQDFKRAINKICEMIPEYHIDIQSLSLFSTNRNTTHHNKMNYQFTNFGYRLIEECYID